MWLSVRYRYSRPVMSWVREEKIQVVIPPFSCKLTRSNLKVVLTIERFKTISKAYFERLLVDALAADVIVAGVDQTHCLREGGQL